MARIIPFECPLTEREKEIQEIITRSGLPVPDVYWHRKYMTDIAVRVQTAFNEKMVFLPFDHVAEVGACGGILHDGDEKSGPRSMRGAYESLADFLDVKIPHAVYVRRLEEIIKCCSYFRRQKIPVFIEGSGPLNVLFGLMETETVLRDMRKEVFEFEAVIKKIADFLVFYYGQLVRSGAKVISIDDSASAVEILGNYGTSSYTQFYLYPFLCKLEDALHGKALIHLCPKVTNALIAVRFAKYVPLFPSSRGLMTYEDGILTGAGKVSFMGQLCFKSLKTVLPVRKIYEVRMKNRKHARIE